MGKASKTRLISYIWKSLGIGDSKNRGMDWLAKYVHIAIIKFFPQEISVPTVVEKQQLIFKNQNREKYLALHQLLPLCPGKLPCSPDENVVHYIVVRHDYSDNYYH